MQKRGHYDRPKENTTMASLQALGMGEKIDNGDPLRIL